MESTPSKNMKSDSGSPWRAPRGRLKESDNRQGAQSWSPSKTHRAKEMHSKVDQKAAEYEEEVAKPNINYFFDSPVCLGFPFGTDEEDDYMIGNLECESSRQSFKKTPVVRRFQEKLPSKRLTPPPIVIPKFPAQLMETQGLETEEHPLKCTEQKDTKKWYFCDCSEEDEDEKEVYEFEERESGLSTKRSTTSKKHKFRLDEVDEQFGNLELLQEEDFQSCTAQALNVDIGSSVGDALDQSTEEEPEIIKISSKETQQPPSRLQMVLDEYHSQTRDFSNEERLDTCFQLPDIAIGYFNESGGSLSIDDYDVHLTIPPGAIRPDSNQEVYIHVDPREPPTRENDPTGITLSRSVHCGPPGVNFAKTVVLSFPHQADVTSINPDELTAQMCQDDDPREMWEEFDGDLSVVTKDRVILFVSHFTKFKLKLLTRLMSLGRSGKRLLVGAYGDDLAHNGRPYQIRVYLLDDDKAVKKTVEANESSNLLDGFKNLIFRWGMGDVLVKVSQLPYGCQVHEGEQQIIYKTKIKNHPSNYVTFTLGNLSTLPYNAELFCSVEAYQRCEDEESTTQESVRLSICPAAKAQSCSDVDTSVCDRGAAGVCEPLAGPSEANTNHGRESFQDTVRQGFSKRDNGKKVTGDCNAVRDSDFLHRCEQVLQQREESYTSCDAKGKRVFVVDGGFVILGISDVSNAMAQLTRALQGISTVRTKEKKMRLWRGIEESTLLMVSGKLGPEWEKLAIFLGFSRSDLFRFKNDNPYDTSSQIFQMLVEWGEVQYPQAQVETLRTILNRIRREDIAYILRDIEDSSLRELSQKLGPEWEELATPLGFSAPDILEIKKDLHDRQDQILQMLITWRNKQLSPEAQLEWLCCELTTLERDDLADELRGRDPVRPQQLEKYRSPCTCRQSRLNDCSQTCTTADRSRAGGLTFR
ncbi:uncharacterized protein LOC110989456 isoform X2 [Acanthaster planci]|uniref:Netrin receptor UNC5 n=1 Tax=Acanthaster planci TaxID=133434 RepID=A0A8B8A117_ACAPL|nr:uncharacterized protein LOC110989456 isoform X2 [Acanthaster planci]